jgi:hypothetical protein
VSGAPLIRCPGCGGRNPPDAQECEWCARPFKAAADRRRRWWPVLFGVVAGLLIVIGLAYSAFVLMAPPDVPRRSATGTPSAGPSPATTPSGLTVRLTPLPSSGQAQVVNTEGQGASLRKEPTAQADRLTVLAEGSLVRIVGPEVLDDGRAWVEVQDGQGNSGWVQADLLRPVAPASPTPR